MDGKLIVNEVEVDLGHDELSSICGSLSDSQKNEGIFHELAKSPSEGVRESVAWKKRLPRKTARLLLNDTSIEVLREIVGHGTAKGLITEEDISRLIAIEDTAIMVTIAENVYEYDNCDQDFIYDALINQADPQIRYQLAQDTDILEIFLKRLTKDQDIEVSEEAKKTLEEIREEDKEDLEASYGEVN
jgi:hypothetical protein